MSIKAIIAAAYVTTTPDGEPLTHIEMRTLVTLATYTGKETHTCTVSVGTLSQVTTISTKTLYGALKSLEAWGFITRSTNVGAPNTYTLDIEAMRACHGRSKHGSAQAEAVEVEIAPSPVEAVEAPLEPANVSEAMITQEAPESPAEAPSEPAQSELTLAPAPKKARKPRKGSRAAEIPGLEEDFTDFYTAYPRHVGRGTALRAYERARRAGASASEILDGAHRYAEATAAAGTEIRYIKHPSTWLNAQCWLDDMDAAAPRELTPTQRKVHRLAQSLQAMQEAQGLPQTIGNLQATRELIHSPASQVAPMGTQDAAPADSMWSSARWTRTRYGAPQLV